MEQGKTKSHYLNRDSIEIIEKIFNNKKLNYRSKSDIINDAVLGIALKLGIIKKSNKSWRHGKVEFKNKKEQRREKMIKWFGIIPYIWVGTTFIEKEVQKSINNKEDVSQS